MAKKKISQSQQQHPKSQEESAPQEKVVEAAMENQTEKLANLKSLNALLVKETCERREQIDALQRSKLELESEVERSALEKQRLDAEKMVLEEQMAVAKLQQGLNLVFVAEQVNQQVENLKNQFWKEKEEMKAQMEVQVGEIDEVCSDFRAYRVAAIKEVGSKDSEIDRFRMVVLDLERRSEESRDEIRRILNERDGVVEENVEMKRRFEDLKREMEEVVRQRSETEKEKSAQELLISELRKAVDVLNADVNSRNDALQSVTCEKDRIQNCLDVQMDESKGLKAKLLALEESNLVNQEKIDRLQKELGKLLEDRKGRERTIECLGNDKSLLENRLVESSELIEDLKNEIGKVSREKEDIEAENAKQVMNITELQKEVAQLRAIIATHREEEESLRSEVYELGKRNAEAIEKQESLYLDFGKLVAEKSETERNLELLMEENELTRLRVEEAWLQLANQKRREDEIVSEKAEIERVKAELEVELLGLHKEINNLQDSVSTLKNLCDNHVENNKKLQSEAECYKDALRNVTFEKDGIQKKLGLKTQEESSLRSHILELETSVEEKNKKLEQLGMKQSHLLEEKKEFKNSIELLMEEKSSLQNCLLVTEGNFKNFQEKVKSYELYAEKSIQLLRNMAEVLSQPEALNDGKVELTVNADDLDEEFRQVVAELEAIKRVFMDKEAKVQEMSQELGFLKKCLLQAEKKKSFWTWLCSATTILAAASLAYVSRAR